MSKGNIFMQLVEKIQSAIKSNTNIPTEDEKKEIERERRIQLETDMKRLQAKKKW